MYDQLKNKRLNSSLFVFFSQFLFVGLAHTSKCLRSWHTIDVNINRHLTLTVSYPAFQIKTKCEVLMDLCVDIVLWMAVPGQ